MIQFNRFVFLKYDPYMPLLLFVVYGIYTLHLSITSQLQLINCLLLFLLLNRLFLCRAICYP
jgi:hypothetical protein